MQNRKKLYEFVTNINKNEWDDNNAQKAKAKKMIKEGENVKASQEECLRRLLAICAYEEERLENNFDSGFGLTGIAIEELTNTIREIISEVRYSWDIYEWMSDVEKEKKMEDDITEMIIRVSIKKGLPTKSVNKIILSYHRGNI
tara:strand:- start:1264 stop:1695 length:432 start_codon:yes stop_codon:yes gene_type:complete